MRPGIRFCALGDFNVATSYYSLEKSGSYGSLSALEYIWRVEWHTVIDIALNTLTEGRIRSNTVHLPAHQHAWWEVMVGQEGEHCQQQLIWKSKEEQRWSGNWLSGENRITHSSYIGWGEQWKWRCFVLNRYMYIHQTISIPGFEGKLQWMSCAQHADKSQHFFADCPGTQSHQLLFCDSDVCLLRVVAVVHSLVLQALSLFWTL